MHLRLLGATRCLRASFARHSDPHNFRASNFSVLFVLRFKPSLIVSWLQGAACAAPLLLKSI
jgi:hypothetical protein